MYLFLAVLLFLSSPVYGQSYLVDQHFSAVPPAGWSSTSNVWAFNRNETATGNYRSSYDATKYSARFSGAANGNSIYVYIPVNFKSDSIYTITFYTKRACSVEVNTNELPNQTTLLSNQSLTNSNCNSNWNTWYQWSFTTLSTYTGTGYFQIWIKTVYGGPASVYLDDVSIFESSPQVLPIELLYFRVKPDGESNQISWATATETNNNYFILDRTLDGQEFEPIARVDGAGNSSNTLEYEWTDRGFEPTINYYRLSQVDFDGRYKYFELASVDNRKNQRGIQHIKTFDILGREVSDDCRGIVILLYSNGSTQLKFKP